MNTINIECLKNMKRGCGRAIFDINGLYSFFAKLLIACFVFFASICSAHAGAQAAATDMTAAAAARPVMTTIAPMTARATALLPVPQAAPTPVVKDLSWEAVQRKGVFVVGLDDTFAPLGFRDAHGEVVGFDVDLAREVAVRLKLRVTFQPCVWDSIFLELKNYTIDAIWNGVSMNPERAKQALFSRPYATNRMVIVVAAAVAVSGAHGGAQANGAAVIKSRADLQGKRIAVQSGSPAFTYVKNYRGADFDPATLKELVQYSDNHMALLDLVRGGVDAVVLDEIVADYYITQKKVGVRKLADYFASEKYGIAFRAQDHALRDKVQAVLDEMQRDGAAARISKKWFGWNIFM
jgi:polar amino acid transport system substrate-binding protein